MRRTTMAATASRVARIRGALTPREWGRVGGMVGFIIAILPQPSKFLGIGVAVTAYTLGLRHAFDADHISAIDNTTRKLMAEGKRPLTVGFWFSLGHSTIAFALTFLIALGVRSLDGPVKSGHSNLPQVTNGIGPLVSGCFLYAIAALNVVILVGIIGVFREMKTGSYDEPALEERLNSRGLMNRLFGRLARTVTKPTHMYPIGVLFGLGFD